MIVMARIPIPSARQIQSIREALKLTQAEAAEKVGVTQGTWSDWESSRRRPSQRSAILLDLLKRKKL